MVGARGESLSPFPWTPDPKSIVRVDSHVLSPLDNVIIHVLECLCPMECNTLITQDREDDNGVGEFLGKSKYYFIGVPFIWVCFNGLSRVGKMMVVLFDERRECLVKLPGRCKVKLLGRWRSSLQKFLGGKKALPIMVETNKQVLGQRNWWMLNHP